jgi:hypothetical protein
LARIPPILTEVVVAFLSPSRIPGLGHGHFFSVAATTATALAGATVAATTTTTTTTL